MDILSINQGMIYWSLITFVALVLILKKFAWGPILKTLDERDEKIKNDINKAEAAHLEAEALLNQHKQLIANSEHKASEILKMAKEQSDKYTEQAKHNADEQARKILEAALVDIKTEKEAAIKELRTELASLAIQAAEIIIKENLDANKQKLLVDKYFNQMAQN
jgi:F-type H+-transporting ATPase subunit b